MANTCRMHIHMPLSEGIQASPFPWTPKQATCTLTLAFNPTPSCIHKIAIELRLPQALVHSIVGLAHPEPQLWTAPCAGCIVSACPSVRNSL